jgi:hypothetical protein
MLFGRGRIKRGDYVFSAQNDNDSHNLVIGRVHEVKGKKLSVLGSFIRPVGLMERVKSGVVQGRPAQVLQDPDPNNCIFMLIDRVESGAFSDEIDLGNTKTTWINEKRYFVLDGWIRENLPDLFSHIFRASTDEERQYAKTVLLEKMNSLYERDLKEHVYAVARSTRIL